MSFRLARHPRRHAEGTVPRAHIANDARVRTVRAIHRDGIEFGRIGAGPLPSGPLPVDIRMQLEEERIPDGR